MGFQEKSASLCGLVVRGGPSTLYKNHGFKSPNQSNPPLRGKLSYGDYAVLKGQRNKWGAAVAEATGLLGGVLQKTNVLVCLPAVS